MHLWLLLAGSLFVQESISASLIVLAAYKAGYSPLLISLLWLFAALVEIYGGYAAGKFIKRKYADTKLERWILKKIDSLTATIGVRNEKLVLMALTIFTLPVFAALMAVWLDISLTTTVIWCLIGDFIWYATVWAKVLGTEEFASNIQVASIVIVAISVLSSVAFSVLQRRSQRRR